MRLDGKNNFRTQISPVTHEGNTQKKGDLRRTKYEEKNMIFKNREKISMGNKVKRIENPLFKKLGARCGKVFMDFLDFLNICISIMRYLGNKT